MNTKRQWHIELLRAICIIFVIYNHSDANGMYIFKAGESGFVFYAALSSLCKVAVPIFFMISGALLLKREESLGYVLKKRVLKYVIITILASAVMYFHRFTEWSFIDFLDKFIHDTINGRYWFLYEYILFLVSLPFLRLMVRNMEDKHYIYLSIAYFVFSLLLPALSYMIPNSPVIGSEIDFASWIGYFIAPILGYYILSYLPSEKIKGNVVCILFGVAVVSLALNIMMLSIQFSREGSLNENHIATWCIGIEVFIVYLFRWLWEKKKPGKVVQSICLWGGAVSFGIYIIEQYVEDYLHFVLLFLQEHTNYFIGSVIFCGVTFLVGGCIVWLYLIVKKCALRMLKH